MDATSYSVIMELYSDKALPHKAVVCFGEMKGADLPPDRRSYKAVISAHANAGEFEGVRLWCNKCEQSGFSLRLYKYTQLLKACAPRQDLPADPRQGEMIFLEQISEGIAPDHVNLQALKDALGMTNAEDLCRRCGVDVRAVSSSRFA